MDSEKTTTMAIPFGTFVAVSAGVIALTSGDGKGASDRSDVEFTVAAVKEPRVVPVVPSMAPSHTLATVAISPTRERRPSIPRLAQEPPGADQQGVREP